MISVKLSTEESEAVERAYYEAYSYEAIVSILSRKLRADDNTQTADILHHYAELCRAAQMKLRMAQDMVLSRYGLNEPGHRCRFDFTREEVSVDEPSQA